MTKDQAKEILLAANLSPLEKNALYVLLQELERQDMLGEEWRDIEGYEGKYQISSLGRVKSLKGHAKILSPDLIHTGYLRTKLFKDGKTTRFYVHVLVARAFIPNPENKQDVNHKNGVKADNRVENLEWTTRSENIRHSFEMGMSKTGCEHGMAKLTAEQVREIRLDCIPGEPERGFKSFARKFGVDKKIISDAYHHRSYKNVE